MGNFFNKKKFNDDFFTIAEVGQNHQGDVETAIDYVKKFSNLGASAVKFQTRDNKYLFDSKSYDARYNSENAFGITYGEHREFLELEKDDLRTLRNFCSSEGVLFMSTPFDEPSLEFLCEIDTDILKIASFDLGNLPFLARMVRKGKPLVLSCGGGNVSQIEETVNFLKIHNADFCVLHCVSKYPCPAEDLGLKQIKFLLEKFPDLVIGLSDHYSSIVSGPVGYMLGARVFEKHVTLDRSLKGTDHSFALGPRGFENFVRDIENTKKMNDYIKFDDLGGEAVFKKLGKSVAAFCNIKKGGKLTLDNLRGKIFATPGVPVRECSKMIGKTVIRDIGEGDMINWNDINEA